MHGLMTPTPYEAEAARDAQTDLAERQLRDEFLTAAKYGPGATVPTPGRFDGGRRHEVGTVLDVIEGFLDGDVLVDLVGIALDMAVCKHPRAEAWVNGIAAEYARFYVRPQSGEDDGDDDSRCTDAYDMRGVR